MSGTYFTVNQDAISADEAAVASGLTEAVAAVATSQREAAAFMAAHGADVLPGHGPVNQPGRQGDPDSALDPADVGLTAPAGASVNDSQSADSAASVAYVQQLQEQAQQAINSVQHQQIGSRP